MIRSALLALGMIFVFEAVPAAQAQVTLDISKITCEQFVRHKISDPDHIAIWISGYYNGTRGNAVLDTQKLITYARKLHNYCFLNQKTLVIKAVEEALGADK